MSKFYAQWRRPPRKKRPWKVHPIWRGIGCFVAILVPLVSYALSHLFVEANKVENWIFIPFDLRGPSAIPFLFLKLLLAVVIALALFSLYTFIYVVVYQMVGPPKYGPMDSPPLPRRPSQGRRRNR
jgi:hypothetical protein